MTTPESSEADSDPSLFALGITASVVFVVASYVTATLVYAFLGRDGIPISPLLLTIPAVPANMYLMHIDEKTPPGRAKNRILAIGCYGPLVLSLILVVAIPLPVLTDTIPVGGAFGTTMTVCVITGVLLLARAQWKNRER